MLNAEKDGVAYFWGRKHIRKRVVLVYECHIFSLGVFRPGRGFNELPETA